MLLSESNKHSIVPRRRVQPSSTAYSTQGYPFPPQAAPIPESNSFQPVHPYPPPPDANAPSWGYPPSSTGVDRSQSYGPPALPSIHAITRTTSPTAAESTSAPEYGGAPAQAAPNAGHEWQLQTPVRDEPQSAVDYRTWPQQPAYPTPMEVPAAGAAPAPAADPREAAYGSGPPGATPASATDAYPPQARYSQEPFTPVQSSPTQAAQPDSSMYASASYAQQQHQQHAQAQAQYPAGSGTGAGTGGGGYQEPTPPSTIPPLPRHTYTRTLVGPLASNACRLLDEHRKPAIFFLFQDLSIRTEGERPF